VNRKNTFGGTVKAIGFYRSGVEEGPPNPRTNPPVGQDVEEQERLGVCPRVRVPARAHGARAHGRTGAWARGRRPTGIRTCRGARAHRGRTAHGCTVHTAHRCTRRTGTWAHGGAGRPGYSKDRAPLKIAGQPHAHTWPVGTPVAAPLALWPHQVVQPVQHRLPPAVQQYNGVGAALVEPIVRDGWPRGTHARGAGQQAGWGDERLFPHHVMSWHAKARRSPYCARDPYRHLQA
jgi:hypothetical protein